MSDVPLGSLKDPPNAITASRMVVMLGCLVCLSAGWYTGALVAFIVAASTDWVDGFWARRWGPITKLGRVLDPLADKLLICGVFTYLSAVPESRVPTWAAVVVLAREFLVTTLRGLIEGSGGDFSAVWIGKYKFGAQVVVAIASLYFLSPINAEGSLRVPPVFIDFCLWLMVGITIASGLTYTLDAIKILRRHETSAE